MGYHVHLQDEALSLPCGEATLRQLHVPGALHKRWKLYGDMKGERYQRKKGMAGVRRTPGRRGGISGPGTARRTKQPTGRRPHMIGRKDVTDT